MMKVMRIIAPTVFLLFLTMFCASSAQAQECTGGFAEFIVLDSEGKSIPDVTIELVAELSEKEYEELWDKKIGGTRQNWPPIKLSPQAAEDIIKRSAPRRYTTDLCGNPLKQRATLTKVKYRCIESGQEKLGFCTRISGLPPFLLKISAPDYLTDYYVGKYLNGCACPGTYKFVLSKEERITEIKKSFMVKEHFNHRRCPTTHSTRPRDSMAFIVVCCDDVGGCTRGAG